MRDEGTGQLAPSSLRSSSQKSPNYRSPDRIELHYDGLLSLDPVHSSDGGLLRQLAVRDVLKAGPSRRGGRMQRRLLQGLAWFVLILAGGIIGSQFYLGQHRVQAADSARHRPELLRASAATTMPVSPEIQLPERLRADEGRHAAFVDDPVKQPESKAADELRGGIADLGPRVAEADMAGQTASVQTAQFRAEAPAQMTMQQAPAKQRRNSGTYPAGNQPQECSDAVMALQLCGSER